MTVAFRCQHCGANLKLPAGTKSPVVKCPGCGQVIPIPKAGHPTAGSSNPSVPAGAPASQPVRSFAGSAPARRQPSRPSPAQAASPDSGSFPVLIVAGGAGALILLLVIGATIIWYTIGSDDRTASNSPSAEQATRSEANQPATESAPLTTEQQDYEQQDDSDQEVGEMPWDVADANRHLRHEK